MKQKQKQKNPEFKLELRSRQIAAIFSAAFVQNAKCALSPPRYVLSDEGVHYEIRSVLFNGQLSTYTIEILLKYKLSYYTEGKITTIGRLE